MKKRIYGNYSVKKLRDKMYLEAFGILLLLQVGYVGGAYISLMKELDLSPGIVHAQVIEKELPMQDWVLNEINKAGIDKYKAYMIIQCESNWNSQRTNINKGGRLGIDRGLWQLSDKFQTQVSNSEAFDYKASTFAAIKIIKKQGFKPWICAKLLNIK